MQRPPIDVGQVFLIWLIPVDVVQKIGRGWLIGSRRGGREVHEAGLVDVGNVVGHDWLIVLGEKGVKYEAEIVEVGLVEVAEEGGER